jgi:hypothetical protein
MHMHILERAFYLPKNNLFHPNGALGRALFKVLVSGDNEQTLVKYTPAIFTSQPRGKLRFSYLLIV